MANVENPVGAPLHTREGPQHAYDAAPGTITGWVVSPTRVSTLAAELSYVVNVKAHFDQLPEDRASAAHQEQVGDMANAVLGDEGLCPFLTVTTLEGQEAVVSVMSRIGKYVGRLGDRAGYLQGKTFGYLGEVDAETGQLPTLLQMPDGGMIGSLVPSIVRVPTAASVASQYTAMAPQAGVSRLVSIQPGPADSSERLVPRLHVLPMTWVPYFLGFQAPEEALKVMQSLVAGLESDVLRNQSASLVDWCLTACVRAGVSGAPKKRSILDIRWLTPVLVAEREVLRWMSMRLAAFRSPTPPVLPTWQQDPRELAAEQQQAASMAAPGGKESKEYSPYEKTRIMVACGLFAELATERDFPSIYATMLVEGRTLTRIEAVLQNYLLPTVEDLDPVRIYVSPELVRDVKELRFGYDNDLSFENCHRGISPFCVMAVTVEHQAKRRRIQERADRATFLSTADVQTLEAEPGKCPTTYHGMRELLRRYIKLLDVLFLPTCPHAIEVRALFQLLGQMVAVYEVLQPAMVVELLWQVFIDARACFSHPGPLPARSELALTRHWVKSCSLKTSLNCPVVRLIGGGVATPSIVSDNLSRSGGSTAGSTISTLSVSQGHLAATSTRSASGQAHTNPAPVPEITAIMGPFREQKPGIGMRELMRTEKQAFAQMVLGPRGTCMDFVYFGECSNVMCTYNHSIPPGGITVPPALLVRLKKMTESNLMKA